MFKSVYLIIFFTIFLLLYLRKTKYIKYLTLITKFSIFLISLLLILSGVPILSLDVPTISDVAASSQTQYAPLGPRQPTTTIIEDNYLLQMFKSVYLIIFFNIFLLLYLRKTKYINDILCTKY